MKKSSVSIESITTKSNVIVEIPKNVYILSENEMLSVRNSPGYLKELIVDELQEKPEFDNLCWRVSTGGKTNFLKVIDIVENFIFIFSVPENVLNWSKVRYAIDNSYNHKNNHTKIGIVRYPIGTPSDDKPVFRNINELKQRSTIYRNLDATLKNKVCIRKNIVDVEHIFVSKPFGDRETTGKFLYHLYLGSIRNGKYTGVHHIYPVLKGIAKIEEILDKPNINGVWRGVVALKDKSFHVSNQCKEWKYKDEASTFFPNNWGNIKLIEECKYAFDNKTFRCKKKNIKFWDSKTISGIDVELITNMEDNLISMYPNWKLEKTKLNV